MAATLPQEIYKFSNHCRYLKKLKKQTQSALEEIRTSGKFYSEQVSGVDFTSDESTQLSQIFDYAPCFIILGQNSYSKSCFINELFCQPILPLQSNAEQVSDWRCVCFQYGVCSQASLVLPDSYELAQPLLAHRGTWQTIPEGDLELNHENEDSEIDPAEKCAVLEIKLRHVLLKDETKVVVSPSTFSNGGIEEFIAKFIEDVIPILVYTIADDILSEKDINELKQCKNHFPHIPVFFIRTPPPPSTELTESEQHFVQSCRELPPFPVLGQTENMMGSSLLLFQRLCEIGYLSILPNKQNARRYSVNSNEESEFVERFENVGNILLFVRHVLRSRVICATSILNEVHSRCLRMFIMSAFDMTRDMLITPKRLEYAREKETELYNTLNNIASHKQDEIRDLIVQTITNSKEELMEKAATYEFKGVVIPDSGEIKSAWEIKICTAEIQDLILGSLNTTVAKKLINSVEYLKESFVGTLERCLQSLENACREDGDSPQASAALTQILNAAYQVEVTTKTSSSFMRALWEKMKQLVQNMPWKTPPRLDEEWKMKIATDMINRLSETRLARSICSQFRDKLKQSHDNFQTSLKQLEAHHTGRLERTEERRLKVRKQLAPKLAKYALESTSLRDALLHGMPHLGREIGRGQYGVVYSCDSWSGYSPCALKSVVPPDEKHWNDLAMEFYYTKSIPPHDHVVAIRGSVIDHSYAGGSSPAVLLIMDKLQRDLHAAIKAGLSWLGRLQVAIDVVQGIRYLHSQGLIHRDVKLKNVLLDKRNRAKITDLGFCKPEAMMSGSIVGTPIHMAPELFSGRYDSTVDVYAFGILFWYICAGHVRLPYVYEQCQNKDQLWTAVRKGSRPERLPQFDLDCWTLMEECWSGDAICRPLLGDVEYRLRTVRERYKTLPSPESSPRQDHELSNFGLSVTPYIDADADVEFVPS